jgi:thiol-disulfide isomerase/thioredoxin/copper chaperone CopZ
MRAMAFAAVLLSVPALARAADRTQTYSVQGTDCASCADAIKAELRKIPGVKTVGFDKHAVELYVRMRDDVADELILDAIARAGKGFKGFVGAGQGAYLPIPDFPAGSDMQVLTSDGSAVGPLPRLAVAGKYTVFDVYADWCGPCREVDERLRKLATVRKDVAFRRLNVRDFDTPLARELGPEFETLPFVVVMTPAGKRFEISGTDFEKLDLALQTP